MKKLLTFLLMLVVGIGTSWGQTFPKTPVLSKMNVIGDQDSDGFTSSEITSAGITTNYSITLCFDKTQISNIKIGGTRAGTFQLIASASFSGCSYTWGLSLNGNSNASQVVTAGGFYTYYASNSSSTTNGQATYDTHPYDVTSISNRTTAGLTTLLSSIDWSNVSAAALTMTANGTASPGTAIYLTLLGTDGTTYTEYSGTDDGLRWSASTGISSINFNTKFVDDAYVFSSVLSADNAKAANKAAIALDELTASEVTPTANKVYAVYCAYTDGLYPIDTESSAPKAAATTTATPQLFVLTSAGTDGDNNNSAFYMAKAEGDGNYLNYTNGKPSTVAYSTSTKVPFLFLNNTSTFTSDKWSTQNASKAPATPYSMFVGYQSSAYTSFCCTSAGGWNGWSNYYYAGACSTRTGGNNSNFIIKEQPYTLYSVEITGASGTVSYSNSSDAAITRSAQSNGGFFAISNSVTLTADMFKPSCVEGYYCKVSVDNTNKKVNVVYTSATEARPTYVSTGGENISASSTSGQDASMLVDESGTSTKWCINYTSGTSTAWISVQSSNTILKGYELYNGDDTGSSATTQGRRWKNWTVEGSLDGTTWTILQTITDAGMSITSKGVNGYYLPDNTVAYNYYRFTINDNEGGSMIQMSDLKFLTEQGNLVTVHEKSFRPQTSDASLIGSQVQLDGYKAYTSSDAALEGLVVLNNGGMKFNHSNNITITYLKLDKTVGMKNGSNYENGYVNWSSNGGFNMAATSGAWVDVDATYPSTSISIKDMTNGAIYLNENGKLALGSGETLATTNSIYATMTTGTESRTLIEGDFSGWTDAQIASQIHLTVPDGKTTSDYTISATSTGLAVYTTLYVAKYNAKESVSSKTFGEGINKYHYTKGETTYYSDFNDAVDACTSATEIATLLNSVAINLPTTGFYRFKSYGHSKSASTDYYMNADESTSTADLHYTSTKDDKTIFYYDATANTLQAYYNSLKVNSAQTSTATPSTIAFEDATAKGDLQYRIKSGSSYLVDWGNGNNIQTCTDASNDWIGWYIEEVTDLNQFAINYTMPEGVTDTPTATGAVGKGLVVDKTFYTTATTIGAGDITVTLNGYTATVTPTTSESTTTFEVTFTAKPYFNLAIGITGTTESVNNRAGQIKLTVDGSTTYKDLFRDGTATKYYIQDMSTLALSMYGIYRGYTFTGFYNGDTSLGTSVEAGALSNLASGSTITAKFTASTGNGENLWYYANADTLSNDGAMGVPARIPALCQTQSGRLIAFSDLRPGKMDCGESQTSVQMRYSDDGKTWSDVTTLAKGLGDNKTSWFNYSFGDAAVVADNTTTDSKNVLMICCAGNAKFGSMGAYSSTSTWQQVPSILRSTDGGETWSASEPESLASALFPFPQTAVTKIFFSSGHILQDTKKATGASYNRIYSSLVTNDGDYVVYSDDWGTTWKSLGQSISNGDEAHVELLPDGSILACTRLNNRTFNLFTYTDFDNGTGTWGTQAATSGVSAAACNGDLKLVDAYASDGTATKIMLMSAPANSSPRRNVTIYYKALTKSSDFAVSDFTSGWSSYLLSPSSNTELCYKSAYSTIQQDINTKKIWVMYEEARTQRTEENYSGGDCFGYNEVLRELSIETITGNTYYTSNPTVAGTYNYTLTDQCGNTYTGQLTNTTLANVPTALKTAYPIISEVGGNMEVEETSEGVYSYSNTITLPFKVSNASNTYWQNIYFPSNTNDNNYPVYWKGEENATLPTTATESLAYGASTYNTKNNANKVSWAIYNSGNQFKFTFKNQLTGMYLYVADGTTPYNNSGSTLANVSFVDGTTTAATTFDILKNTSYAGDYAISFNDYYLCAWSASNGTLTYGTDKTHNGAYVKIVDAPDFTTLIASANTNLGYFNDKIGYYASDNEAATAAKTAMQNSDNVTLNNMTAYAALTGTVVLPSTDKYYRLKGSVSGKYAYSQGAGKQMKMSATESDYKTAGLFLFDGDNTNGFTLLNYKDGLYVYDTHSIGSSSSEVSNFTFAAPTTAHVGTLTIKQVEDISSHGHWMYDNGNNGEKVDRNSSYASQNCDWILEEVTVDLPVYKKEGSTDEAPEILGTVTNSDEVLAIVKDGAQSVDLTGATISSSVTIDKTFMDGVTTNSADANTLVYVPSGTKLDEDTPNNVIVKGEDNSYTCASLVLSDDLNEGCALHVPTAFTASKVSYERTGSSTLKWGTVMLPYAPQTSDNVVYYELTSQDGSALKFTKVTTPAANVPYLYKNTSGANYKAEQEESTAIISVKETSYSDGEKYITGGEASYVMKGVFLPSSISDGISEGYTTAADNYPNLIKDANALYIKSGSFWKINKRFTLKPFRAYITTSSEDDARFSNMTISIDEDTPTGVEFIESEDGNSVDVIYDINGARLQQMKKGINIVNGKKVVK